MTKIIPIVEQRSANPEPYTGEERRADWHTPTDCFKLIDVQQRLDDGSGRMTRIEASIKTLDAKVCKNNDDTSEILDILKAAKGFFKVVNAVGQVLKWVTAVCGPIIAIWFSLHGTPPPK